MDRNLYYDLYSGYLSHYEIECAYHLTSRQVRENALDVYLIKQGRIESIREHIADLKKCLSGPSDPEQISECIYEAVKWGIILIYYTSLPEIERDDIRAVASMDAHRMALAYELLSMADCPDLVLIARMYNLIAKIRAISAARRYQEHWVDDEGDEIDIEDVEDLDFEFPKD